MTNYITYEEIVMKKVIYLLSTLILFTSLHAEDKVISSGEVLINSKPITNKMVINLDDVIETKKGANIRFNIGADAFMAKENSRFSVKKSGSAKTLDVISGGVLAVFKGKNHKVKTPNLTAGMRGTAIYTLVEDDKSYFCDCYGEVDVNHMDRHKKRVLKATHHNPIWITKSDIKSANEMIGHTDKELRLLEAMVGRVPDFDR